MKSIFKITAFSFLLVSACTKQSNENPQTESDKPLEDMVMLTAAQEKSAKIKMGMIRESVISSPVKVSGRLEAPPQNLVSVSTPFAGFVKSTDLLQGMEIKKGQVIAEMQHPDYIQFQQDYMETKSQLDFLEAEYKRQETLAKDNINSEKTLQQARSNYTGTLAKVQGLKAKLQLMNFDLPSVEKGGFSSVMRLYSPIDGYVTDIKVNIGQYVNPTDLMFKIVNTKHLHVELRIFEKDVLLIRKGQTITFTLAGDTAQRKAVVYLIGHEIGEDRSITVHGHLEKEEKGLMPGMYLQGEIETNPVKTTVLPREAVVSYEGTSVIFIATAPRQYKMIFVQTGLEVNGLIEIRLPQNQNGNQSVVVQGAYSLLSKMKNTD